MASELVADSKTHWAGKKKMRRNKLEYSHQSLMVLANLQWLCGN